MKKELLRTIFLGCLLMAALPLAKAQTPPPKGPDPVLVSKAEQGDLAAQKKLGDYYFIHNDNVNGLKWVQKSAEGGNADAQNSLGFRYENGKGVPEDVSAARKWYRMAAEQGNANGQANLCKCFMNALNGSGKNDRDPAKPLEPVTGSKADVEEAIKWCDASAQKGAIISQYNVGLLQAKGSADVKPNYEASYFWLTVKGGDGVILDKIKSNIPEEKRTEIEKSAKAWKPGMPLPPDVAPPADPPPAPPKP